MRNDRSRRSAYINLSIRQEHHFFSPFTISRPTSSPRHPCGSNSDVIQHHPQGVSMFIVETTKSGVQVSDRLEGIKSPRSLPLYGVTFNNVNLHHSDLLGRGETLISSLLSIVILKSVSWCICSLSTSFTIIFHKAYPCILFLSKVGRRT